jgi:hypothetical protein
MAAGVGVGVGVGVRQRAAARIVSLSLLSRPPHVFVFITNKKLVSNSCSNEEAQA